MQISNFRIKHSQYARLAQVVKIRFQTRFLLKILSLKKERKEGIKQYFAVINNLQADIYWKNK